MWSVKTSDKILSPFFRTSLSVSLLVSGFKLFGSHVQTPFLKADRIEIWMLSTVKALVSGHPRDGIKMSVTGAGRLREWFS